MFVVTIAIWLSYPLPGFCQASLSSMTTLTSLTHNYAYSVLQVYMTKYIIVLSKGNVLDFEIIYVEIIISIKL